jgi:hypothetical protein
MRTGGWPLSDIASIGGNLFARVHQILDAAAFGELILTLAHLKFFIGHLPLLHSPKAEILSEENVEAGIYTLKSLISDKDNTIETFQNHADLGDVVPAVRAAYGE